MICAPFLFSTLFAAGKFTAVFLAVGVGSLLVVSFIFYKIYQAREGYNKEALREILRDDQEEQTHLMVNQGLLDPPSSRISVPDDIPLLQVNSVTMMKEIQFTMALCCHFIVAASIFAC